MKFQEDKAKPSTKGTWCSKSSAKDKEETLKQKKKKKKNLLAAYKVSPATRTADFSSDKMTYFPLRSPGILFSNEKERRTNTYYNICVLVTLLTWTLSIPFFPHYGGPDFSGRCLDNSEANILSLIL